MWHKAKWMGHPMRLELTRVGLLVKLANRYTTRGALNTYTWSWLTESEDSTPVVQIKFPVRNSVWTPEFDMKHLKKAFVIIRK